MHARVREAFVELKGNEWTFVTNPTDQLFPFRAPRCYFLSYGLINLEKVVAYYRYII